MMKKPDKATKRAVVTRDRVSAWLKSVYAQSLLVLIIGTLCLIVIFCAAITPERYDLRVGSIAHQTIVASKDVVDEVTTEARRQAAANAVEPSYHLKEGASEEVMNTLEDVFEELAAVQAYGQNMIRQLDSKDKKGSDSYTFTSDDLDYAKTLLKNLALADYQMQTLLNTSDEAFETMRDSVTAAVRNSLNTTIREGQVTQSIQTIQQLVGYRVETDLLQNVVTPVLRKCVKANMVIEQEATAQAQEKARAEVEPVIYVQGQNIVREGERVTANQLAMLRSLGLLDDDSFDLPMYSGAVLVILCAMASLLVVLRLVCRRVWLQVKQTIVLMLVLTLTFGLCCGAMKISNAYLAPIVMGAMLLTGLLGTQIAIAGNVALTIMVSALTAGGNSTYATEMVHLLLTGLMGGTFAIIFLKGKPQRVRVVICGLGVAVVNLVVILAIGLMTNNDLNSVLYNGAWSMGGGIAASLFSVALQPVFETAFNLATPSKLLEWTNPNQPLSRKLLLEAAGTYHHSLIVANLAEAAAEAIGANPLLVRAGAYYHDVGKLKRPMYFKENQKGENPHDATDPYVSAAIVTAHMRDGVQLAKKYRLPTEIQDIILEHHGDTPVMYFYHKALQQANGNPVDIRDFRYDGKRPHTKESAIVMLADTIEAAVRAMPDPTPSKMEAFIERLIRGKLEDGQLSESPLTLQDIDKICAAFIRALNGAFHERIEYPNVTIPHASAQTEQQVKPHETVAQTQDTKPVPVIASEPNASPADDSGETTPTDSALEESEKKPEDSCPLETEKMEESVSAEEEEKRED